MRTKVMFYDCDSIELVRDPEFPDLLEIRLNGDRWETIRFWSSNDKPVVVTTKTLEKINDQED